MRRGLGLALCVAVLLAGCGSSVPSPAPSEQEPLPPGAAPRQADGADETGAAGAGSAGTDAPPATESPVAPPLGPVGQWKWIDVPGAVCGYGQPTGFAVNAGTGSDVLFFLEGGGLCWDELSCRVTNDQGTVAIAHHFTTGYDEQTLETQSEIGGGLFDRNRANNPFKNSTVIYVPYCTGDFHSGSTTISFPVAGKTAHFAGRQNLDLFLAKVVPALPNASRITLAGSSAGGYGALINFWHVKEAFGNKRVDLITDSSPALWNNALIFAGLGAWNTAAALPPGCPQCQGDMRALYSYYAKAYPESRIAVSTNDKDAGISLAGYALTFWQFSDAIHHLTVDTLKPLANVRYFVADGTEHGVIGKLDTVSQPHCCQSIAGLCLPKACGTAMTYGDWLTKMVTDDPTWQNQSSIIE